MKNRKLATKDVSFGVFFPDVKVENIIKGVTKGVVELWDSGTPVPVCGPHPS